MRRRPKGRTGGNPKKLTFCPECKKVKKKVELGVRDMREHRYKEHGWDFRRQKYLVRSKFGGVK